MCEWLVKELIHGVACDATRLQRQAVFRSWSVRVWCVVDVCRFNSPTDLFADRCVILLILGRLLGIFCIGHAGLALGVEEGRGRTGPNSRASAACVECSIEVGAR